MEKTFSGFSNRYLDIGTNLNIAKYLIIAKYIFENAKSSKERDKNKRSWEQCKEIFGGSSFLLNISNSAAQVLLL